MRLIKIRVSEKALKAIADSADELDMKQFGVASRVYETFGRLPADVRLAVLQLLPKASPEKVIELIMESLKKRK